VRYAGQPGLFHPVKRLPGAESQSVGPGRHAGLKIGLAALDTGRMGIGAQAVGIAQAALEEAVRNTPVSVISSGFPSHRHQAIQTMIADMATQVDAAPLDGLSRPPR
jgi:alkylation response protein AidB-like acyl-CoA dehydrogenase